MSDLKTLRSHALAMADPSAHLDSCGKRYAFTRDGGITEDGHRITLGGVWCWCKNTKPHPEHDWDDVFSNGFEEVRHTVRCEGTCTGCVPAAERALWRQIADEIGAHLKRPADADQEALPL